LPAAVEKSADGILKQRLIKLAAAESPPGIVEIGMLKGTCRPSDVRYCAAHGKAAGFAGARHCGFPSLGEYVGVGFFLIWTVRCVGGLARADNDNVLLRQMLIASKIVPPAHSSSTMETQ
jgi:hypothetical protein